MYVVPTLLRRKYFITSHNISPLNQMGKYSGIMEGAKNFLNAKMPGWDK
jgi:hypothetical protein